jgi:small-conductance mechanosensitive channel
VGPQRPTRLATTGYLVLTALLVALLAAGVILTVTAAVGAVRGGHTVTLDRVALPEQLASLPPNAKPTNDVPVTVTINDASPLQLVLRLAIDLGYLLLVIVILWHLRGLVRSARQGDPFTTANVRRLREVGLLLMLGWPVVAFLSDTLKNQLSRTLPIEQQLGSVGAPPIGTGLLFGLGVLVLAEVFAHGVRLREDVEGTI